MNIEHRTVKGVTVIDLQDDKFEYPKTQVLKNYVIRYLQDGGTPFIVLNLSNVTMLDSFGIAVFISILKLCKAQQGNLTMYALNDQVTRLIELTRMDRVLDIWEEEGEAVAHVEDD